MNKNPKKEEIIRAARKLFYENGYINTNLKDIAQECDIKKQTISYYFKSKALLGLEVYDRLSNEIIDLFIRKARAINSTTDISVACASSMIGIVEYYQNDKNAFRFFEEFYFSSLTNIDIVLKESERHMRWAPDLKPITLQYISAMYASNGVLYYYIKGYLPQYTFDEFCAYYTKMALSGIIKDNSESNELYNAAKELYPKLNITFDSYFIVK